jgi:hypothetical protein
MDRPTRKAKRKRKAKRSASPRTRKKAASRKSKAKKKRVRRRAAPTRTGPIQVDYVRLSDVVRWPRNPKQHADDLIAESIDRFGYVMPVLVDDNSGRLVAGHGRLDALEAKRQRGEKAPDRLVVGPDGEWMIPVIRGVGFENEAEAEAYLIGDNELTTRGGWNEALLADVLNSIRESAEGLMGTGFNEAELTELEARVRRSVVDVTAHQRTLSNGAHDQPKQAVTQPGDVWTLGHHRLLCGESVLPESVARLVECDAVVRRWQSFASDDARLEETGQTFSQVVAERAKKPAPKASSGRRAKVGGKKAKARKRKAKRKAPRKAGE